MLYCATIFIGMNDERCMTKQQHLAAEHMAAPLKEGSENDWI
jgi:hypothetical protein